MSGRLELVEVEAGLLRRQVLLHERVDHVLDHVADGVAQDDPVGPFRHLPHHSHPPVGDVLKLEPFHRAGKILLGSDTIQLCTTLARMPIKAKTKLPSIFFLNIPYKNRISENFRIFAIK